ncbi:MAG: RIP metalloprotease RseP [Limisphaerales bacterium]|jgi:regulator of sigma E protease|nr:RIP metalloprotease RseP [Verrucomicrobiota bacterium]
MDLLYSSLQLIYVIVCVLLLFGAAVFVHEFGHFWVALKCGMKVEEFAIGFGPKIKSWKRNGIEYSLRWIPAGGFVRLPQMVTSEALEGASEEPCPPAAPWKRILTAFAGPTMNLVFAFALATLLCLVGLPYLINPPVIGYVDPASEEYQMGIRYGDEIVMVDGKAVRSWEEVNEACILSRSSVLPFVMKRDGVLHTNELKLTVDPNIHEISGFTWKLPNLGGKDLPVAQRVEPDGAGAQAGMQDGDHITSFNGMPVLGREHFVELVKAHPGQECQVAVSRPLEEGGMTNLVLSVVPADVGGQGKLSVYLTTEGKLTYAVQWPGPWPWENVWSVFERTYKTIAALFYSKETGIGVKDLSGPPGILAMLAAYVKGDYRLALNFMVLLNVSLAILNLLPIPVLDGGHIVMSTYEWVTRRSVSIRFLEYVNTAFAFLLIGFMIYVSFNDIKKFSLFSGMYKQGVQFEETVPAGDK